MSLAGLGSLLGRRLRTQLAGRLSRQFKMILLASIARLGHKYRLFRFSAHTLMHREIVVEHFLTGSPQFRQLVFATVAA